MLKRRESLRIKKLLKNRAKPLRWWRKRMLRCRIAWIRIRHYWLRRFSLRKKKTQFYNLVATLFSKKTVFYWRNLLWASRPRNLRRANWRKKKKNGRKKLNTWKTSMRENSKKLGTQIQSLIRKSIRTGKKKGNSFKNSLHFLRSKLKRTKKCMRCFYKQ